MKIYLQECKTGCDLKIFSWVCGEVESWIGNQVVEKLKFLLERQIVFELVDYCEKTSFL